MKKCARIATIPLLAALLAVTVAPGTGCAQQPPVSYGQDYRQQQSPSSFSQEELDQMLAPVALYPDSLLSQILMAATYPLEVVEAARWSRQNPQLQGSQAVSAADQFDWDPSVKSLTAFPQILSMMDGRLDWTRNLGDAFLDQQDQVMDTVQKLRRAAYDAGNLRTTDQLRVGFDGSAIGVDFADPQVVYVPYYDPTIVYGTWWWPAYPPVYWGPWRGYARAYLPGFYWGPAIQISVGFFFGAFDWHSHHVNIVNTPYYNNVFVRNRPGAPPPGAVTSWRHDPAHRMNVPYRSPAVRQQFSRVSQAPESRQQFRGYQPPSTAITNRPPAARETTAGRPQTPVAAPRPAAPAAAPPAAAEQRPSVFETIGQGSQARDYSARGRASYEQRAAPAGAPAARPPAAAPAPRAAAQGGTPAMRAPASAPAPRAAAQGGAPRPSGGASMRR